MRGLQLTILITTAIVLFGIAGWAMWHTWAEQELPPQAPTPDEHDAPESLAIDVTGEGEVRFKQFAFPLDAPDRADVLQDVGDALRVVMKRRPLLEEGLRSGKLPLIITVWRGANPEHAELIRRICKELRIQRIVVQTGKP